jgi:hypothetical protein
MPTASSVVQRGKRPRRQTLPADILQSIHKQPARPHRRARPYTAPSCRFPQIHRRR